MRAFLEFHPPRWMMIGRKRALRHEDLHRCHGSAFLGAARRDLTDETGASAVEFALVASPFLLLCLGILQFLFLQYAQLTLSDALYTSASLPEAELIGADLSGYKKKICAKIPFGTQCLSADSGIKIEMMPLDSVPTTATAITGATFNSGASGDVLVLRASMPAPQIMPFLPVLMTMDSVIFRRPLP